ncbi:MAG: class I SAM-dependent methyltransferase [Bryobacteraceae bacterium]
MGIEFTGERVVPGLVDVNLWNEHMARYAFAARLCRGKRVLDAGCGTGYGAAELAQTAASVTGVDVSQEALAFARQTYTTSNAITSNAITSNAIWIQASCTQLPVRDACCDLVVAFEVIEHLRDWELLLKEARRVLAPDGRFVVSTPNKSFYTEARSESGPNPFHEHEFEYAEFRETLEAVFPHVSLFVEDHTEGVLFRALESGSGPAEALLSSPGDAPENSNFFIAVCGLAPMEEISSFLYVPSSANLLRERGTHIRRLEDELAMKDAWLNEAREEHRKLVEMFRLQKQELETRAAWAMELNEEIGKLRHALDKAVEWARENDRKLAEQTAELGRCVELLEKAESTVEERTEWALKLDRERQEMETQLSLVQSSRWLRLGRLLGLGPELRNS